MLQSYLKIGFLETPRAYTDDMGKGERDAICEALKAKLPDPRNYANDEGAQSAISPGLVLKCSYFPHIIEEYMLTLRPTNSLINGLVCANHDTAMRLLMHHYTAAIGEKLELILLSNPEAVLELLDWSRANKTGLRYSLDVYLPAIYQDISAAWRYFQRYDKVDEHEFFDILWEAYGGERRSLTPQGALLRYIQRGGEPDSQVSLNPKTAIAAAILSKNIELCINWVTYPKWAYHILKEMGKYMTDEQKQTAMQALIRILPWTYQYMVDTHLREKSPSIYQTYMSVAATKWENITEII